MEIKEAVTELKNLGKIGEDSKKCATAKKHEPVECYIHIHGHPTAPKK